MDHSDTSATSTSHADVGPEVSPRAADIDGLTDEGDRIMPPPPEDDESAEVDKVDS